MTTKYQKTKRLMKSTGLSKKECQKLLRSCKWDYDAAYESVLLRDVDYWAAVGDGVVNAINALNNLINTLAEEIPKILNAIVERVSIETEQEDKTNEPIQEDHKKAV